MNMYRFSFLMSPFHNTPQVFAGVWEPHNSLLSVFSLRFETRELVSSKAISLGWIHNHKGGQSSKVTFLVLLNDTILSIYDKLSPTQPSYSEIGSYSIGKLQFN